MLCALLVLATPTIGPPPKTWLDNLASPAPDCPCSICDWLVLDGSALDWPASWPESSPALVAVAAAPVVARFGFPPSIELAPAPPSGDAPCAIAPTAAAPDIVPPPNAAAPATPAAPVSCTSPTWRSLKSLLVRGSL